VTEERSSELLVIAASKPDLRRSRTSAVPTCGDAALTRRARRASRLSAVVAQWSRTRKRYERQSVLAEPDEQECLADSEVRQRRRERDAQRGDCPLHRSCQAARNWA
jgi:hypothetical protein